MKQLFKCRPDSLLGGELHLKSPASRVQYNWFLLTLPACCMLKGIIMPRLDHAENDRKKQIEKVSQELGQTKIGTFSQNDKSRDR